VRETTICVASESEFISFVRGGSSDLEQMNGMHVYVYVVFDTHAIKEEILLLLALIDLYDQLFLFFSVHCLHSYSLRREILMTG